STPLFFLPLQFQPAPRFTLFPYTTLFRSGTLIWIWQCWGSGSRSCDLEIGRIVRARRVDFSNTIPLVLKNDHFCGLNRLFIAFHSSYKREYAENEYN